MAPNAKPHADDVVDTSDVPVVSARELALTLKLLGSLGHSLAAAERLTDQDIRRVEQAFWHHLKRNRARKTAVLLRFRCLVEVCRARRLAVLIANNGQEGVVQLMQAAASMRLNTAWGFNPQKLARAVDEALRQIGEANAAKLAAGAA